MDRLSVLKTFIAVAEKRSFAEAARGLGVSAAATSRAVASLEEELGVALFRRTTRTVALTDEGAAYLERCRNALSELEDAARELRGDSAEPRGMMAVTAPVVFGRMHIGPIIARLLREHASLQVRAVLTDRNAHLVEDGIDVAVRIGDLADSSMHGQRVAQVRRVLVASPDYLRRNGMPDAPIDLRGHSLIALDSLTPNSEWRFDTGTTRSIRVSSPRLVTNDVATAVDAVVAGLGIARVLSYQVRDHIAAGLLIPVLEAFAPPPIPVTLLYLANRRRSPNVRAFLDAASAYFQSAGTLL